jgi:hypothetical protein
VPSVVRQQVFAAFLGELATPGMLSDDLKTQLDSVSVAVCLAVDAVIAKRAVRFCGWHVQQALKLAGNMVRDVVSGNTCELPRGNVGSASAFHKAVISQMANLCIARKALEQVGVGSIAYEYVYG